MKKIILRSSTLRKIISTLRSFETTLRKKSGTLRSFSTTLRKNLMTLRKIKFHVSFLRYRFYSS